MPAVARAKKPDPKDTLVTSGPVSSLSGHPMEKRAIQALLNGKSMREVAKFLRPKVSYTAVHKYFRTTLRPTMENAEKLQAVLPEGLAIKKARPEQNIAPIKDAANTGTVNANHLVRTSNKVGNCTDESATDTAADTDPPKSSLYIPPGAGSDLGRFTTQAILSVPLLHLREGRIQAKIDRHRRMQVIVNERAAAMGHVPGGSSGLLSKNTEDFDGPLVRAFEENEKNLAIELGQWQENALGTGVSVQIVMPQVAGDPPRVSFATQDTVLLEDGGFEEIGVLQK